MFFNSLEEYESFRNEGVLHIPIQYVEKSELKQYRRKQRMEYKKEYYELNKHSISLYQREYYQKNNNEIKQYVKKYNDARRDELNQKCLCDCGRYYSFQNKARHDKSKLHEKGMQ